MSDDQNWSPDPAAYRPITPWSVSGSTPIQRTQYINDSGQVRTSLEATLPEVAVKLYDENDVAYGVKHYDNKPRVSCMPYTYDIAEGKATGHNYISKFGHNSDVAATLEDVWDGSIVYSWPTTAAIVAVLANAADVGTINSVGTATGGTTTTLIDTAATFVSDGVVICDLLLNDAHKFHAHIDSLTETTLTFHHDTGYTSVAGDVYRAVKAGGTGAAAIEIQGLDASFESLTEFVVLTGAAAINSVNSFLRIFRAKVIHAGTAGWNVGAVTMTGAALVAQISAQMNQTLMALWTVPNGKKAYITRYYASSSSVSKATEVHLYIRHEYGVFQIKHIIATNGGNPIDHQFPFPILVEQHSDITIQSSTAAGAGEVSAGFDAWYEDV